MCISDQWLHNNSIIPCRTREAARRETKRKENRSKIQSEKIWRAQKIKKTCFKKNWCCKLELWQGKLHTDTGVSQLAVFWVTLERGARTGGHRTPFKRSRGTPEHPGGCTKTAREGRVSHSCVLVVFNSII